MKANEEANRLRTEQQEAESKFEVCSYGSSFSIPFSNDANPQSQMGILKLQSKFLDCHVAMQNGGKDCGTDRVALPTANS